MSHVNPRMRASDSIPFWMYSVDVLILLHPCLHFVAIRIHVVAMYVCRCDVRCDTHSFEMETLRTDVHRNDYIATT